MKRYEVYIEVDDQWELFGLFEAVSGSHAVEIAKQDTDRLLQYFRYEHLPYINMDFEEVG